MKSELEIIYNDTSEHCVLCGKQIPEGKQYCYFCEHKINAEHTERTQKG